jgi:hypothetical protein
LGRKQTLRDNLDIGPGGHHTQGRNSNLTCGTTTGAGHGAALIALGFYVIKGMVSIFTDYGEGTPSPLEAAEEIGCAGNLSERAQSDGDRRVVRAGQGVDPVPVRGVVGVVPRILYGVYVYHSTVGEKGFGKSELSPFSSLKCIEFTHVSPPYFSGCL